MQGWTCQSEVGRENAMTLREKHAESMLRTGSASAWFAGKSLDRLVKLTAASFRRTARTAHTRAKSRALSGSLSKRSPRLSQNQSERRKKREMVGFYGCVRLRAKSMHTLNMKTAFSNLKHPASTQYLNGLDGNSASFGAQLTMTKHSRVSQASMTRLQLRESFIAVLRKVRFRYPKTFTRC